jgi:putative endonuclease
MTMARAIHPVIAMEGRTTFSARLKQSHSLDRKGKIRFVHNDYGVDMTEKEYYVYIMTNIHNTVLYTGVTNNLQRRVLEHKSGKGSTFTARYQVTKLVYFEMGGEINGAIFREKQIKAGSRQKKIDLINRLNPEWKDLFDEYFNC